MTDKPVFFDASGRRASRISLGGRSLAVLAAVVAIAFVTESRGRAACLESPTFRVI